MSAILPASKGNPLGLLNEDIWMIRDAPWIGGVNNRFKSRDIGDTQIQEGLNVDLSDPTVPKKRQGYTSIRGAATGLPSANDRLAMLSYFDAGAGSRLMVTGPFGNGVFFRTSVTSSQGWTEARVTKDASGTVDLPLNLSSDMPVAFQGGDLLWIIPGVGAKVHAMEVTGQIIDCGIGNNSPPTGAVDGTYFLERVWFLSGDRLFWSKLLPVAGDLHPTPSAFVLDNSDDGTAGGFITLSPYQSASPIAVRAWRRESLLCFFKNQVEEVIVNGANPLNSFRHQIESRIGCGSRAAIVQIGDAIYFPDQYGHYRELRQNQLGETQGIIAKPVSDPIAGEIPGRLNKRFVHKMVAQFLDDDIFLFYPRDNAQECSHCMVYSTADQMWTGPWEFAQPLANLVVSDIDGNYAIYATDASADEGEHTDVVRMFDEQHTDNGESVTFSLTSKAYTGGVPETDKQPNYVDVEFSGDIGEEALVYLRTYELQDFEDFRVAEKAVSAVGESDYPINAASYPIFGSAQVPVDTQTLYLSDSADDLAAIDITLPPEGDSGAGGPLFYYLAGVGFAVPTALSTFFESELNDTVGGAAQRSATSTSVAGGNKNVVHHYSTASGNPGADAIWANDAHVLTVTITSFINFGSIDNIILRVYLGRVNSLGVVQEVLKPATYLPPGSGSLAYFDASGVNVSNGSGGGFLLGAYVFTFSDVLTTEGNAFQGPFADTDRLLVTVAILVDKFTTGTATGVEYEVNSSAASLVSYVIPEQPEAADSSYPISDHLPRELETVKEVVSEETTGDLPLSDSDLPMTTEDLPIYGDTGGPPKGRIVQWRVENVGTGAFELYGVRVAGKMHNVDKETEP